MAEKPLSCSYILLTYNQEKTVAAAVQSALQQAGAGIEIVITDDCSVDSTFEVIKKTITEYDGPHRIRLNRNDQNLGLAGNIAKAHEISTGDVIIAAAGDDMSFPQRSQRIMDVFAKEHPLLVCSYANTIGPDDQNIPGNFRTALFYHTTDLLRAARSKSLYIGATGAWHRDLYEKYGPLDPEAYEDLVLGFRAALENRISVIKEELVDYRLGSGLTSSDMYFKDIAAFQTRRMNSFVTNQAIMRQRLKDAKTFGLPSNSKVWKVLKKTSAKGELGLSYYQDSTLRFILKSLRHPLFGLFTWHSEKRRGRKMSRRIDQKAGQ